MIFSSYRLMMDSALRGAGEGRATIGWTTIPTKTSDQGHAQNTDWEGTAPDQAATHLFLVASDLESVKGLREARCPRNVNRCHQSMCSPFDRAFAACS